MLREGNVSLAEAVGAFVTWFGPKSMKVWGNGSAFDNVILRNAMHAVRVKEPWHYRDEMCYRTVTRLIKVPEAKREGTYHNALDDAKHQAKHLIKVLTS